MIDGFQPILAGSPPHDDHGGPSFAQMLRQGQGRKQPMWPTMTSASAPRRRLDSDPPNADGLDYAPAPEFRQTFSSALAAAFDKAAALSTGQPFPYIVAENEIKCFSYLFKHIN